MRSRPLRIFLYIVVGLVVLLAAAISATIGWRPFIGPRARPLTNRTFNVTPERLERGRYLVRSVNGCLGCNSNVDTGSDMLARAIREGIGHDGRALFPIMPYPQYRAMSDEDLASVIVYIRTLDAVSNPLPRTEIPFPPGPLINSVPEPVETVVPQPDLTNAVTRGEYLARIGVCTDCHTPMDATGARLPGMEWAGGMMLSDSKGQAASANLTPDPSGIPYYTEELFLTAMRTGAVISRDLNDVMPWWFYRNMTDEDLKAIYAYLKTLKPVQHRIDNTLPVTDCPACGLRHGGGERNAPRD
jgi:mono/diheme cytochrome c family protein